METKKDNILLLILSLNALSLLFPSNFKFVPIALLGLYTFKTFLGIKKIDYCFLAFSSLPYIILLFGMLHTHNLDYGLKRLETAASLIIYPLFFSMVPKASLKRQFDRNGKKIFIIFIISVLIYSFGVLMYFIAAESRSLVYLVHHFNTLIDKSINPKYQMHSIYLALYLGLNVIFSTYIIFKRKSKKEFLCGTLILMLSIVFLLIVNKRMAILSLGCIGCLMLFINFNSIRNKSLIFLGFVLIILIVGFGVLALPRYKDINSFKEFANLSSTLSNPESSTGKRILIYKEALNMASKKTVFGYGTGDANQELSKKVRSHTGIVEHINTHNQFLSYLVFTGILGMLAFLYYNIIIMKTGIKRQDMLFIGVFLFFFFNMLSENILEREAGVIIYAFFVNLFLRKNWNNVVYQSKK